MIMCDIRVAPSGRPASHDELRVSLTAPPTAHMSYCSDSVPTSQAVSYLSSAEVK